MPPEDQKTIVYKYRGPIERWSRSKRSYVWHDGFSPDGESGGPLYPWSTKAECRKEARTDGCKAVFEDDRNGQVSQTKKA